MRWKPTLYVSLRPQVRQPAQPALFALEPRTDVPELPLCDHDRQPRDRQRRIDGGTDVVCGGCGARLEEGNRR